MSELLSPRRVQRVRHEIKARTLRVSRIEALSPHIRSITFHDPSLADFVSASFDDHIKFIFDSEEMESIRRDYTPRTFDPVACELTLEFALHGAGPAARWAAQAAPGQTVTVAGPRGSMIVPVDYDWHLLIGDDAALPAIARRLEELPPQSRAIVIVQMADAADRRPLATQAVLELQWVDSADALLAAARALSLPDGEGYAWCAGEAGCMSALRRVLVDELGHDRHAMRVAAYWKHGASDHHGDITAD
jgi:NADPH-dependent ferric siderophore reductase